MTPAQPPAWTPPEDIPAGLSPALLDWCWRQKVPPPPPQDQDALVAQLLQRAFGS